MYIFFTVAAKKLLQAEPFQDFMIWTRLGHLRIKGMD